MKKVKEGYKMTEIGEIPSEWKVKKLGEITIGKGEYGIGASATEYIEGKPRYLRITDIGDSCRLLFNEIKGLDDADYEKYILKEGDIVFARTGNTTGKGYVYNREHGELVYAGFLIKYSIDNNIAKHNFIKYVIQSKRYWDWVSIMSTRSGQPGINSNEYSSFIIQLPPLKEQEKIASILSTVDEQIDNVDALIEKNKELKKGLLQTLLTKGIGHTKFKKTEIGEIPEAWKVKKIIDIANTTSGGTPSRAKKEYYENGIYPWVKTGELYNKYISKTEEYITEDALKKSSAKLVPEGAVIIAMYGATIGKLSIAKRSVTTNQACCSIICNNNICYNEYLYYRLNFEKENIINLGAGGAQPNISQDIIKNYKLAIPTRGEQQRIVLILSELDKKIDEYENKKQKLEELKRGLMQQLLTGKIRV